MRWGLLVLAALLLSGCAGSPAEPSGSDAAFGGAETMVVNGVVADLALVPIAGANVTLLEQNITVRSGPAGEFTFPPQPARIHNVRAQATGFLDQTLVARPGEGKLSFGLTADRATIAPYNVSQHFRGHIDCAMDTFIIPGPCDILFEEEFPLFTNASTFFFNVETEWKTIVLDLAFEAQPTMPAMRLVLRATSDADQLTSYEQYGRFSGTESFSVRLEPGVTYEDSTGGPLPPALRFQADIYPQGYLWHEVCGGSTCFTGAGFALNVEFELVATAFYVEPAPDGFTLLP